MKKREPRLFSMMRTLMQLAHSPGSTMTCGQTYDTDLSFGIAVSM